MNARWFLGSALGLAALACGSSDDSGLTGTGTGGSGGSNTGGSAGSATGGASGSGTGGSTTGGSAGTAAGGTAGQATGGAAGGPGKPCAELEAQYAERLAEAKACDLTGPISQCTKMMPNQLACPCDTFVNHNNQDAINALGSLAEQWNDLGCAVPCPEIACQIPLSGNCTSSGGKGTHCEDIGLSSGG